jgi:hypothetical protein
VAADDGAEHGLERRRRGRAVHAAAGRGDALEERAAAEVLHDEDELSVVGDVVLVELDDVGVVELHERRDLRGHLCANQIFNPTSMCAYANVLTRALPPCFENSLRAIDSSKHQPNRLRFDRAREF